MDSSPCTFVYVGGAGPEHEALLGELTRRSLLRRASLVGLGALVASAGPLARGARAAAAPTDALMQAFADTMVPGRRAGTTESGAPIDPLAIAGVDPLPGAVEADALALYSDRNVGFSALAPGFIADLETRTLQVGGVTTLLGGGLDFLHLPFDKRVQVCMAGLDFSNPSRTMWEIAAAVPFIAFCAAVLVPEQTAAKAVGYQVMGLPGVAPNGYSDYSYGRRFARERTVQGSLP